MKLYNEPKDVIYFAQNKDPFFSYLTSKIIKPMHREKRGRVLDIGCGTGRNVMIAAKMGFDAVGVDINGKALEIAADHIKREGFSHRVKFIKSDVLLFKKGSLGLFDFCILSEVIEHVENYQKIIDFAYSSLKKGGYLLLSTPNDPGQWNILDEYAEHIQRFRKNGLKKALSSFKEVNIYTVGFPFHRLSITAYHSLLKLLKRKHKARIFRSDSLFPAVYYMVGTVMLKFDDFFNFTGWGTTLVAIARK